MNDETILFKLPRELKREFEFLAIRRGLTVSSLLRMMMTAELKKEKK